MTGKVAIITRASRGIGAGLVAGYRGQGWAVVASARAIKPSQDPDVLAVAADLADPAAAGQITGAALDRFRHIATLVNHPVLSLSQPCTGYTPSDYATTVGVNLTWFFWIT